MNNMLIQTTDGVRVYAGGDKTDKGVPEDQALASVKDRNRRAAEMGLTVRYEVVPYPGRVG